MRSLLFEQSHEQSQEVVCVEVGKSLQLQEQDPSPVRKINIYIAEEIDGKKNY